MKHKMLFCCGAICAALCSIMLIPALQEPYIQGALLAVFSLSILTFILISEYKNTKSAKPDACTSLCEVLYEMLSWTFLFNAFCMLFSQNILWPVSMFQSAFSPIILAGFIGHHTRQKLYRYCSEAMLVISVIVCSDSCDITTLTQLAILSNIVCIIFPVGVAKFRKKDHSLF